MIIFVHSLPIADSVGQWAPIVGTGLAAVGSLYLLVAADLEELRGEANENASMRHCNCSHHHYQGDEQDLGVQYQMGTDYSPSSRGARSIHTDVVENLPQDPMGMQEVSAGQRPPSSHSAATPGANHTCPRLSDGGEESSSEMVQTTTRITLDHGYQAQRSFTTDFGYGRKDVGNRRKVAKTLTKIGNYLGTAAHDQLESEFKHGKALDFPEIPGEEHRNPALPQIRERYNPIVTPAVNDPPSRAGSFINSVASRHSGEYSSAVTPAYNGSPSRAGSFINSVASRHSGEHDSTVTPRAASPRSPQSLPSPLLFRSTTSHRPHANALPAGQTSFEPRNPPSSQSAGSTEDRIRPRRDTLEVPSPVHHSFMRNNTSPSQASRRS